jgi:biopolymer transport protein TolQ
MEPTKVMNVILAQAADAPASAAPPNDYGFVAAVLHAGLSEQIIMLVLLGFSVVSWAIIVYKWRTLRRAYAESESFLDAFWSSKRLDAIFQKSEDLAQSPISQVFRAGYIELAKLKKKDKEDDDKTMREEVGGLGDLENIERSMRRAAATERTALESLVSFLATTGSSAPFIGLLGTVAGIISSFQEIGRAGNANLATVAPGVGGALVATAFGLFAAIPAVIAYNYFTQKIRVLDTEMANFSSDFLNIVKRHFF